MQILGSASERDMVAAFLAAEVDSSRFASLCRAAIEAAGLTEAQVRHPDLDDEDGNRRRAKALLGYRGWQRDDLLFAGFPRTVSWYLVRFERDEARAIRYSNSQSWVDLSLATCEVGVAARRLLRGEGDRPMREVVEAIFNRLLAGEQLAPIIVLGTSSLECLTVLEGSARLTAMALLDYSDGVEAVLGVAPHSELLRWPHLPNNATTLTLTV